jgi:small-conductance mechanosensitive channel
VINFSKPDEQLRVQLDFEMAYGEDPEQVEAVIVEAVRKVDGVVPEKPVDVLLKKVSKGGLTFRLRWWMQSYQEGRYGVNKVLRSVYSALNLAEIEMSLDAYDLNVFIDEERQPENLRNQLEEENG